MFRVFRTNYTNPSDRETRISRNFWLLYALTSPELLNPDHDTFWGKYGNDCPAVEVQSLAVGERCLRDPGALWSPLVDRVQYKCEYVLHSEEDWQFNQKGFLEKMADAHKEVETGIDKGAEDGATIDCLTKPEGGIKYNRTSQNLVGVALSPEENLPNSLTCSVSGYEMSNKWFMRHDKTDKIGWRHWTNRPSLVRPSLVLSNTSDSDWALSEGKRAGSFNARHWTMVYLNSVEQIAQITHLGGQSSTKNMKFGGSQ